MHHFLYVFDLTKIQTGQKVTRKKSIFQKPLSFVFDRLAGNARGQGSYGLRSTVTLVKDTGPPPV